MAHAQKGLVAELCKTRQNCNTKIATPRSRPIYSFKERVIMSLLPPSDGVYISYEAAYNAILQLGKMTGYAVLIKRTKKTKSEPRTVRKVWFECDRAGIYVPKAYTRETASKKTGCPFE